MRGTPLFWVVGAVHDAHYLCVRKVKAYTHHVEFINGAGAFIASTGKNATNIDIAGLNKGGIGGGVNWTNAYANIIAHEALWLGLLGKVDDINAQQGSLPSGLADRRNLVKISTGEAALLRGALGE